MAKLLFKGIHWDTSEELWAVERNVQKIQPLKYAESLYL